MAQLVSSMTTLPVALEESSSMSLFNPFGQLFRAPMRRPPETAPRSPRSDPARCSRAGHATALGAGAPRRARRSSFGLAEPILRLAGGAASVVSGSGRWRRGMEGLEGHGVGFWRERGS